MMGLNYNLFFYRYPILADPISMDIAMRSSYRSRVPEGRLSYGFNEKPLNLPQFNTNLSPDIPEEKLFNVNPGIIEYKSRQFNDDSDEDDDDNDEGKWEQSKPKQPCGYSYGDLGYAESNSPEIKFVNVEMTKATPAPPLGDDCFGRVVDGDEPDSKPQYFPAELADSFPEHIETMT